MCASLFPGRLHVQRNKATIPIGDWLWTSTRRTC
jgi:hypothetical protein